MEDNESYCNVCALGLNIDEYKICNKCKTKTIKITVIGGLVENVENLPTGWNYEIDDLDLCHCKENECCIDPNCISK